MGSYFTIGLIIAAIWFIVGSIIVRKNVEKIPASDRSSIFWIMIFGPSFIHFLIWPVSITLSVVGAIGLLTYKTIFKLEWKDIFE